MLEGNREAAMDIYSSIDAASDSQALRRQVVQDFAELRTRGYANALMPEIENRFAAKR
jgi:hypothetical protein